MLPESLEFGVELETHVPTGICSIGLYHHGVAVPWLRGWKAEHDGSIFAPSSRRIACEFVSGRLMGADGVLDVAAAASEITRRGGKVNASCGVHVTIGCDPSSEQLARLITLVGNHEIALYACGGAPRRMTGRFCKSLRAYQGPSAATDRAKRDRYHIANLVPLRRSDGDRAVEFRCFSGSLNPDKLRSWVVICLALVAMAHESEHRTGRFAPPPASPEDEVRRLLGRIENFRADYGLGAIPETRVRETMLKMAGRYAEQINAV